MNFTLKKKMYVLKKESINYYRKLIEYSQEKIIQIWKNVLKNNCCGLD